MKEAKFLKSAAVLSVGGILAKGIGALYRIPLAGLLGGYGMGLYHMAYPLFCLMLTFSSSGIPTAFSRMIAREEAARHSSADTLWAAIKLFALIGLTGGALMCLIAPYMSALQGDTGLTRCYLMLAPSVFFVALIAVFRGYFQGKNDMAPTAVSEVLEQLVKAGLGLYFAQKFSSDPIRAAAWCLLAVSLSECSALLFLVIQYQRRGGERGLRVRGASGTEVLLSALPVMAATGLLPLSQTADSILIVRLLGGTENAVTLYGLFSGGASALISLPATACFGLAAASVPAVSRAFACGEREEGRLHALKALLLTLALAIPGALGLFVLARPIVSLLYGGLSREEGEVLVLLLRELSISAVTLAGVDTLAACLAGMGRARAAALSMLTAIAAKFLLQWALVPRLSIGGAAIAANACYLVAFFLDLLYTVRKGKERVYDHGRKSWNGAGGSDPRGEKGAARSGRGARAHSRDSVGADA